MSSSAPTHTSSNIDYVNFVPELRNDTYPAIDPKSRDLSGKYVLITGASKGIGRATSISYAAAGASGIVLAARTVQPSLEADILAAAQSANRPPPKIVTVNLDVTSRETIEAAAKKVDEEFGRLDILINNAGYLEKPLPIGESDPDDWWRTWEVNVRGTYLVTRSFIPLLLKGSEKTIINLSSVGAHRVRRGASAYQTTKLVDARLSEFIVADYGEEGVLSYSIHPGAILTELAKDMPKTMLHLLVDTPELAADTIVFLTSERRDWLAGRYVSCNWDVEKLIEKKQDIVDRDLLKFRMAI